MNSQSRRAASIYFGLDVHKDSIDIGLAEAAHHLTTACTSYGSVHSVTSGCFWIAQLKGPLFGSELGKRSGMSRP
jgi:hypothetical protein